jgi:translocation and assembly module TamB
VTRAFLSRDEWPLVAAGIIAGLLTSGLVLYLFVTGLNGGVDPGLVADPELGRIERTVRAIPEGPGRGLVGLREAGIITRLTRMPVPTRRLRGPLSLTLRDLVWNEEDGARFVHADVVTARLATQPLTRGDAVFDDAVVRGAVVSLRESRSGGPWNFEQVLAELLEDDGEPERVPRRTIQVRNLRVVGATVDVTRPEQRFVLRSVDAQLPILVLSQPGVPEPYMRVSRLTAQYTQPEPEASLALDVADGIFRFPAGTVRFDVVDATLGDTRLAAVSGVWNPADPGYGITAEGQAPDVRFEDFAFMLPESFPDTGTAVFAWSVRPLPGDLTEATLTELDARIGDSRVLGSLTARIGEEQFALLAADLRLDPVELALVERFTGDLPYAGTLVGRLRGADGDITFELTATLTAPTVQEPFATVVSGRFVLADEGVALQRLDVDLNRLPLAALRAVAPALPLDGAVTGRVSLSAPPAAAPLDLDVRLELGTGIALLEGTLDLTGAEPRYDLTGRLVGVELQAVMAPSVPPVALTSSFAVRGTGFDPATMVARIEVAGRFTGWQAGPADTVRLAADVRGGVLDVRQLTAALATARATASGTWRFMEPQSGAVAYEVAVTSLQPWGPYVPMMGDSVAAGRIRAAGTLTGTLERMRLAGSFAVGDVVLGDWQAQSLVAEYDVTTGGGLLPVAVVEANGTALVTPTAGEYAEARLSLRLTPPALMLDVRADRTDGGVLELAATGTVPEAGPREIVLERARLELNAGEWVLAGPARIHWVGSEVTVAGLALENASGDGYLRLDGRVLPLGDMDARIDVAAVPAGDLQRLAAQPARLEGLLWAEGTIRGLAADPLVELEFRIEQGAIGQVPIERIAGRASYRDRETLLDAVAMVDTLGQLEVHARLPSVLRLSGDPVFELVDGLPLQGAIRAERFALAPLAAMVPEVRDVTGVVDAQVNLTGTAESPQVDGSFLLAGGAMMVVPANQRYDMISGDIAFDGRNLVIRDMRVRSDGWLVAGGQIVLERLDEPVLDLELVMDGFRPIGVENRRDAAVSGRLALAGPPLGLELTGDIRLDDGFVVIPQFGGPGADVIDITRPAPIMGLPIEPTPDDGVFDNLRIRDLRVTIGEGAWFMADEARAQVAGVLTVNKIGTSTPIVGTLEGTRGQYTLVAGPIVRRFDIVSAQVRFLGAPTPNPAIDITARRIVYDPGGRELAVDVRITGTFETPRLSLAGADMADIAESELLSFLLFGQPSFALGGEYLPGDALLEQTFLGGIAEVAAIELERGLSGLGLDIFQIRLGAGPLAGLGSPTVIMGRQLMPDVFLTVETGITALFGTEGAEQSVLNTWAVRLDWTFDPRSRLRLAVEPVFIGRNLRGSVLALPLTPPRPQLLIEARRRWTY